MSPSSDESEDHCRPQPPTPPPRRFIRRSAGSFRLPCLTKQDSHEKPILNSQGSDSSPNDCNLIGRIAASLRFAPLPTIAVAGLAVDGDARPHMDRQNHLPLHRASYHGHSKNPPEMNGGDRLHYMQKHGHDEKVIGSAENLVGRVLQEQGLGRYCDPEFVKVTQRELAEAINMTPEELDRAAHRLLQAERRNSTPYLYQPSNPNEDNPYPVPNSNLPQNERFLLSLQDENRPRSQQNYHKDHPRDDKHFNDTRL